MLFAVYLVSDVQCACVCIYVCVCVFVCQQAHTIYKNTTNNLFCVIYCTFVNISDVFNLLNCYPTVWTWRTDSISWYMVWFWFMTYTNQHNTIFTTCIQKLCIAGNKPYQLCHRTSIHQYAFMCMVMQIHLNTNWLYVTSIHVNPWEPI